MRFCSQGTEFCGLYECRGTSFQSGLQIIMVLYFLTALARSSGLAVNRKLSRKQEQKQKP
jgi:hypothetical protein